MGLSRLAALHGVAASFSPSAGVTEPVPETTVVAVLGALGVDATTPEAVRDALAAAESAARARLLPATLVVWSGEPLPAALTGLPPGTELSVRPEDADEADEPVPLRVPAGEPDPAGPGSAWWAAPPLGVHRLTAHAPGREPQDCTLVVAPDRVPQPPGRSHGFLVQLYSLLSARSWGMGDLGDLADLAWSGRMAGRRLRPDQPAARGGARRAHRPLALPPVLPPLPRPGAPARRVRPRVRPRPRPGGPGRAAPQGRRAARSRPGQGRPHRPGRRLGAQATGPRPGPRRPPHPRPATPPTATSSPPRGRPWRTTPCGAPWPRCTAPTGTAGPRSCGTPAPTPPPAPAPNCSTGSTTTAASPG